MIFPTTAESRGTHLRPPSRARDAPPTPVPRGLLLGGTVNTTSLTHLLGEVRSCTVCQENLDLGPRPIVQVGDQARIVIIGQAPGRRVHESGVPWDDPSGRTLRQWLNLSDAQFYDPDVVALVPMGFCYPGSTSSGDKPPRPECAPLWHERLLAALPEDRLEVIIGAYAQKRYIEKRKKTLTETVADWASFLPDQVVLPHPSPRNRHWLTKNPWFEAETLPAVQQRIAGFIS
jgi:uracil-DNA glycosylase